MIKKTLITSLVGFVLLFVSINAKAATFTDDQIVDANKSWTIHFNQEVAFDNLTKQGITVADSKGNPANVIVSLGQDDKTVVVKAPKDGYTPGEKYTLNIGDNVHSKNNKNLKKNEKMNFSVKDDVPDISDDEMKKLIYNADLTYSCVSDYCDRSKIVGDYAELEDSINTYDKLFSYYNKYFSIRKSNYFINTNEFINVNSTYYVLPGSPGARFEALESKVEDKTKDKNKLYVTLSGHYEDDSDEDPICHISYTLVYENGRWTVDDSADYDWNIFDYRDNQ